MHVDADVAIAAYAAFAGMEADPDTHAEVIRPCFRGKLALDGDGGGDGCWG
jgi:hypothetical protein